MQTASADFDEAATADSVVWTTPRVSVDWWGDGHTESDDDQYVVLIADDFDRPAATGLDRLPTGQTWSTSGGAASDYTTTGTAARHSMDSVNVARTSLIDVAKTYVEVLVESIENTVVAAGATIRAGVVARWADASNFYLARLTYATTDAVTVVIEKVIAGSATTLATSATLDWAGSTTAFDLRVQFGLDGLIRARAWDHDTYEPPTWDAEATDTTLTAAGKVGLRTLLATGNSNSLPVLITFGSVRVVDAAVDVLDDQAGDWTIPHAFNDGMPDEVSFVADTGAAEVTVEVGHGRAWGMVPLRDVEYFSPFQRRSALYGYDRDNAPTTVDAGLVTAEGPEHVRVFTGELADIPTAGGKARLAALSATRRALTRAVQPPVVERADPNGPTQYGLTATWPIVWVLHECGIYPNPPAMDGCRLWLPMHGGGNPFVPDNNNHLSNPNGIVYGIQRGVSDSEYVVMDRPLRSIRGPWVGAVKTSVTEELIEAATGTITSFDDPDNTQLGPGDDWLSQAGARGRVQFWIRGDSLDVNGAPGGSASFAVGVAGVGFLAGAEFDNLNGTYAIVGVNTSRQPFVRVFDGSNTRTFTGSALASDGEWYFVGGAWDVAASKLWLNNNGTVSTCSASMSTAGLPATQSDNESDTIFLFFALPTAEIQFSTGDGADPDDTPEWLYDLDWEQTAVVYPSPLELEVVAEPVPRDAWEYISSFARADMAAVRTDEQDRFLYLPRGWFATEEAQTVAETIDTQTKAALPDVQLDTSRIRNAARVTYGQTRVGFDTTLVLDFRTIIAIAPGQTTMRIALDTAATRVRAGTLTNLTAAQIDGSDPSPPGWSYITVNSNITPSASGYATATDVSAEITDWTAGEVTVVFTNTTGSTWYLVNDSVAQGTDFAYLGVYGQAVEVRDAAVLEQYDASVDRRGVRGIAVQLDAVQREADAVRAARRLVGDLAFPVPVITKVEVFADPRRQPGDLVTFDDDTTGADGPWRSFAVKHVKRSADYRQELRLQRARLVGEWGDGVSRWGRCVWAGQEASA